MNNTKRHAPRQTADYLQHFLTASRRRHLLITGSKGCGKTTVLTELLRDKNVPGIETYAVWGQQNHPDAVFLRSRMTAQTAQIGVFEESGMQPVPNGFLTLGIETLRTASCAQGTLAAIDEIGFLEKDIPDYLLALEQLFDAKTVFAVIRKDELAFSQKLRQRCDVCFVDLDNIYESVNYVCK